MESSGCIIQMFPWLHHIYTRKSSLPLAVQINSQEHTIFVTERTKWIDFLPVLIELNGKVGHVLQSLIGEVHLHVDVSLPVTECAWDLQSFSFHCRQPNLEYKRSHSALEVWPEDNKQAEFSKQQQSPEFGNSAALAHQVHKCWRNTMGKIRHGVLKGSSSPMRNKLAFPNQCSQHSHKNSNIL